jgi:hypothetical protein
VAFSERSAGMIFGVGHYETKDKKGSRHRAQGAGFFKNSSFFRPYLQRPQSFFYLQCLKKKGYDDI